MNNLGKLAVVGGLIASLIYPGRLQEQVKLDVETSVFDDATCEDIFGKMYGRVALFNSHVAAYYYWKISEMKGEIGRDNVLVLVDAHPDCEDGLKRNLPVFKSDKPLEEKIKDFSSSKFIVNKEFIDGLKRDRDGNLIWNKESILQRKNEIIETCWGVWS